MFEMEVKTSFTRIPAAIFFIVFSTLHASGHNETDNGLIYILIWTPSDWSPFDVIDREQKPFENCTYNNCFLTESRNYLQNIIDYDVIMFNAVQVGYASIETESILVLPANRSEKQIYCMYALEPARFHEIAEMWNGFFNMTFTFKFSSNVSIPYIVVRDHNNNVIGPKVEMHWMDLNDMNETSEYIKNKLRNKHIAAAWIVSHCDFTPWRFYYAHALEKELALYGHRLDIYGNCGTIPCSRDRKEECLALIESDYYFYLSFENSFGEDYVTEKILNALEHYAVPVVFGGGDFNR